MYPELPHIQDREEKIVMGELKTRTYKPQIKKMGIYFLGSCIMLFGEVMLVWILFSPRVSLEMKLFLGVFTLLCLFYGVYFFAFPLFTRLEVSDSGVSYFQPLYSVFCEWKDLSGVIFTKDHLFLTFSKHVKVNDSIFARILIGRRRIPLEIFVNRFNELENWLREPVLLELQKYIPNLAEEVKRAIA